MNLSEVALEGYDPYDTTGCWDTGWSIGGALKSVSRKVKKAARTVSRAAKSVAKNPIVGEVTKQAQMALASTGPIGAAAAGALGGMAAVVKGQNLEQIGWSALEGASPQGIRQAVQAAHRVRHGEPVMRSALGALASSLEPEGARVVGRVTSLVQSGASIAQLGAARRALGSEEARRAFDAAVGTISRAGRGAPGAVVPAAVVRVRQNMRGLTRPLSVRDPITEAATRRVQTRNPARAPIDRRLAEHPEWAALRPADLARRLGTDQRQALGALDRRAKSWRPVRLSRRALGLLSRMSPAVPLGLFRSDTTGFEQSSGKWVYVVETGDSPYALASKYAPGGKTTAGRTYRALLKANPQYPLNAKKDNFKNFWAGMRLNWPEGWTVPAAAEPVPTVSTIPVPTATTTTTTPSVLPDASASLTATVQAKAILAAWGLSDGANEAGVTGYGQSADDLTPTWTSRDRLMLTSFSRWSNAHRSTSLATDGVLAQDHIRALQEWAEAKAKAPAVPATASTPAPVPEVPKLPAPSVPASVPEVLPTPTATTAPSPNLQLPEVPKLELPPPTLPTPTKTSAAASAKKKSAPSIAPLVLGAAALWFF